MTERNARNTTRSRRGSSSTAASPAGEAHGAQQRIGPPLESAQARAAPLGREWLQSVRVAVQPPQRTRWGGFGGRGQRIANTIFPRRRAFTSQRSGVASCLAPRLMPKLSFWARPNAATESQESILASDEPSKTPPPRIRFSVALVSLCTLVCGPGANRPKHVYRRVTTRKERVVQLPRAGPQRTGSLQSPVTVAPA